MTTRRHTVQARRVSPAAERLYRWLEWLIPTLDKFPRSQRFLLGDRIEHTALDLLERLIEATYTREPVALLRQANLAIEKLRVLLHPAKTFVADTLTPAGFVGYVLCPDGRRRVADDNVRRFAGTLRGLRARVRAGTADADQARKRVAAWVAHAEHADTWRLRHALFAGGPFDPARSAASPPLPAG